MKVDVVGIEELAAQAARLAVGRRAVLGIVGPPGGGKSTLATALVAALGKRSALVGMDGFHYAQRELNRLGRAGRKGAPDTFDAAGYVALLQRLRERPAEPVYAPVFERDLEEPVGSAVPVPPEVDLVVTEGNYLLVADAPWDAVRPCLDACWYIEEDEALRRSRLVARHVFYGKSPEQAETWTDGSDQRNADVVIASRALADRVVRPLY